MRQVPFYLIIGNGRVARHFTYYFSLLSVSYRQWQRHDGLAKLNDYCQQASHILILINDQMIEEFAHRYLANTSAILLHFSGSIVSPIAYGAHPLMCFNNSLYSFEEYRAIPFILDEDAPAWDILFPDLPNLHIRLATHLKAKYHALCVLAGNFSCLLWQKLFNAFKNELNIPEQFAHPFLLQQTRNLIGDTSSALTGPLVRNDQMTLEKNLISLADDPFQSVYRSFIECYKKSYEEKIT